MSATGATGATIAWTAVTAIGFISPAYESSTDRAGLLRVSSRYGAPGFVSPIQDAVGQFLRCQADGAEPGGRRPSYPAGSGGSGRFVAASSRALPV